ncbi:MAG: hypothetical protein KF798_05985 [Candidatus Paracaedibacteraceae bacterium]|nr:hypothetical protein [Candidatus Paracaedibacteraceae bacterium]
MNIKVIISGLALSSALSHANTPYVGAALALDHLSGKRSESLKNEAGNTVTFSKGRSLSANQINGYLFVGMIHNFKNSPLFIAPEFQIGRGSISSALDKEVPDNDYHPLILRNLNPKLKRDMNTSLVVKVGATIKDNYSAYGIVGIDASHFKYTYTYQNIDFANNVISGAQTFKKAKWKYTPVFGVGVGKKTDNVGINLEYRIAPYNAIKVSRTIVSGPDQETVTAKVKPVTSTVMIRLSYFF